MWTEVRALGWGNVCTSAHVLIRGVIMLRTIERKI